MSYNYKQEKHQVISDKGSAVVMKTWEKVRKILHQSEAITMWAIMQNTECFSDSWGQMAVADRLVELGLLQEIEMAKPVAGQFRTFWKKD